MIAEKPIWVRHEGMQIFSIDVQPGGLRFATGGGDHKVLLIIIRLLVRMWLIQIDFHSYFVKNVCFLFQLKAVVGHCH